MYPVTLTLDTLSRPLTEDEGYSLNHELDAALDWLREAIHWIAVFHTTRVMEHVNAKRVTVYELWPRYDHMTFAWGFYYGRVYIYLKFNDFQQFMDLQPTDWQRYRAVSQHYSEREYEFLAAYAAALDKLIAASLPGIKQKNSLRLCAMPSHQFETPHDIVNRPRLAICQPIGRQWFCEDCLQVYNLGDLTLPPPPDKRRSHFEREWAKLKKPERRLEILERDNFTCQNCRRSPLRDFGVKVAVRHIVPVSAGGKTAPDNLQTLCLDCARLTKEIP